MGSPHLCHLVVGHAQVLLHELVGLTDKLHVAILDAVMDHLDVVPCAVLANPVTTRLIIHLCSNALGEGTDAILLTASTSRVRGKERERERSKGTWKMGLMCGHASGWPPGMREGP